MGECLSISGTPFTLAYQSERTRGRANNRQVSLKLSGTSIPKSLKRIDLEISVGGQLIQKSYAPKPNLNDTFLWNEKDVYGRELQGQQLLVARIGYVYDPVYQVTEVFGYNGNGEPITGNAARTELTLWQTLERRVGTMRTEPLGFGGWALDANQVPDRHERLSCVGPDPATMRRTSAQKKVGLRCLVPARRGTTSLPCANTSASRVEFTI